MFLNGNRIFCLRADHRINYRLARYKYIPKTVFLFWGNSSAWSRSSPAKAFYSSTVLNASQTWLQFHSDDPEKSEKYLGLQSETRRPLPDLVNLLSEQKNCRSFCIVRFPSSSQWQRWKYGNSGNLFLWLKLLPARKCMGWSCHCCQWAEKWAADVPFFLR